jgi:hypothetical protein
MGGQRPDCVRPSADEISGAAVPSGAGAILLDPRDTGARMVSEVRCDPGAVPQR